MKEMKMKIIEHCVKSLFMIAVACFVAAASIETNKPTTTEWTVNITERLSSFCGEEIGFRSDGVVVWRKANCATNYFFCCETNRLGYTDGIRIRPPTTNPAPLSLNAIMLTNIPPDNWINQITANATNGLSTDISAIKRAAKEGKVCEALGHVWGNHIHLTLEYVEGAKGCRECKLCKLHQYRYMNEEWK